MPIESTQSIRPKPVTARNAVENILRHFVAAVAQATNYFLRSRHRASDEKRPESVAKEAGAVATTTEIATTTVNATANPTITESFTGPIIADVKVDADAQSASTVLDQEEIQRRRDLVRTLFNDFWTGSHEKPAAFVDRLDQAEGYVNERLAASGEFWQLDAKTRLMLGLPLRRVVVQTLADPKSIKNSSVH
jgi:hypothetical protein